VKHEPQPKNKNLRRVQVPQIRQREQREQGDQHTRPPFQNNYVDGDFNQMFKDQMHCFNDKNPRVFFTKGKHEQYMRKINDPFQNQIEERDIVKLKNNIIPKGLVLLEKLFDKNDVARNPKITVNDKDAKY
jgi:hypothetical protein